MNFLRLFTAARQRTPPAVLDSQSRTPRPTPMPRVARPMRLARGSETWGWEAGGMSHRHRYQPPPPGYVRGPSPSSRPGMSRGSSWPGIGWWAATAVQTLLLPLLPLVRGVSTQPRAAEALETSSVFSFSWRFEWTARETRESR